jgi:predicted dehydrogenase
MSSKCFGIGVIGCGVIWDNGHWLGLQEMPEEAQVRYVYDIDPALTEKAAKATQAKAVVDPNEIFEASDVDVVAILTPPFARVEYVEKACAAGKHLMLEKPMARTLEDALHIRKTIGDSGVKCFVPFARAVEPTLRTMVEIAQSGEIGEPVAFTHTWLSGPYGWVPRDHWMLTQKKSGGPIFDFSIHFIELARACMGAEAAAVIYGGANLTGRVQSDDQATLIVNYEGGGRGEFGHSWAYPPGVNLRHTFTHLVCREGVISITAADKVEVHTTDGVRTLDGEFNEAVGRAATYRNLFDAIETGAPLCASEVEGLRMNEILDAGLKSRASGRTEKVEIH